MWFPLLTNILFWRFPILSLAKNGWSTEANQFFVEQAQGQIIHAEIDDYDENGTPFVTLFKFSQGGNVSLVFFVGEC